MSTNILLISEKEKDEAFVGEVALGAKASFQVVPNVQEAISMVAEGGVQVFFVDVSQKKQYEAFENMIQDTVGLFSEKMHPNAIFFLGEGEISERPEVLQGPLFGHFLERKKLDPKQIGRFWGGILKLAMEEKNSLLKEFFPEKNISSLSIKKTSDRHKVCESVHQYLVQAGFKSRVSQLVIDAVDELLLNALFDAPVNELGQPLYLTVSRNKDFELKERAQLVFQVGFDGERVAVSVRDPFGSLDKNKLLSHISKCYKNEKYRVRVSVANAGIGLAKVYQTGGSLLFACKPSCWTEVIVFFPKTESFLAFREQFHFLSTLFYELA